MWVRRSVGIVLVNPVRIPLPFTRKKTKACRTHFLCTYLLRVHCGSPTLSTPRNCSGIISSQTNLVRVLTANSTATSELSTLFPSLTAGWRRPLLQALRGSSTYLCQPPIYMPVPPPFAINLGSKHPGRMADRMPGRSTPPALLRILYKYVDK